MAADPHLWWYVARASGLVGWALCTLAVLWGLALSTGLVGKRPGRGWLLDLHRFLGGLATIFVAVHMIGLVADSYAHFGPAELLVPLTSSWKPLPVAWGVAGFYLLVAVEATSLARRRLPARLWRLVHIASLPLWAVSTVHLLTAGTDARNPVVRGAVLTATAGVLFATLVRVLSPRTAPRSAAGIAGRPSGAKRTNGPSDCPASGSTIERPALVGNAGAEAAPASNRR